MALSNPTMGLGKRCNAPQPRSMVWSWALLRRIFLYLEPRERVW